VNWLQKISQYWYDYSDMFPPDIKEKYIRAIKEECGGSKRLVKENIPKEYMRQINRNLMVAASRKNSSSDLIVAYKRIKALAQKIIENTAGQEDADEFVRLYDLYGLRIYPDLRKVYEHIAVVA